MHFVILISNCYFYILDYHFQPWSLYSEAMSSVSYITKHWFEMLLSLLILSTKFNHSFIFLQTASLPFSAIYTKLYLLCYSLSSVFHTRHSLQLPQQLGLCDTVSHGPGHVLHAFAVTCFGDRSCVSGDAAAGSFFLQVERGSFYFCLDRRWSSKENSPCCNGCP